jgi:hypothetical protein
MDEKTAGNLLASRDALGRHNMSTAHFSFPGIGF